MLREIVGFSALSLVCVASSAETATRRAPIVWERRLGDDRFMYTEASLAWVEEDGSLFVCAEGRPAGRPGGSANFWLWKISPEGEMIQETLISREVQRTGLDIEIGRVSSLASAGNGTLLLVVESARGKSYLARFNRRGEILSVNNLATPEFTSITRILPIGTGNYLLVGTQEDDAFAMRVGEEGSQIWAETYDRGRTEYFETGFTQKGKHTLLIGWSGALQGVFPIGASNEVWLVECDSEGEKLSEMTFMGRYPSACKLEDGTYAIVYDQSGSASQDIRFKLLSEDLKPMWDRGVISVGTGMSKFRIVPAHKRHFVIAGEKGIQFWMAGLDGKGKVVWHFEDVGINSSFKCHDIVATPEGVFVCTAIYSENGQRQPNFKVGLIKLRRD